VFNLTDEYCHQTSTTSLKDGINEKFGNTLSESTEPMLHKIVSTATDWTQVDHHSAGMF
jgi:hypothetical protein